MSGGAGSEEQFGTVWKNPSSALSGMELGSKQAVSSYIIEPDCNVCLLELNGSLSFLHHLKETNIKKGNHWSTRLWKKPCKFELKKDQLVFCFRIGHLPGQSHQKLKFLLDFLLDQ